MWLPSAVLANLAPGEIMSSPTKPGIECKSALSLTGIKPSGTPHVGNYLAAIQPALALASQMPGFYFIADYHALTTIRDARLLHRMKMEVAATWLAFGLDPRRTTLFVQSDVPEVCELSWILGCVTGLGLLNRAHAYKDAISRGREVNAGTFFYPVLMAADILLYGATLVPVGRDQKQHVEMTRDMALAFNHHFGETLVVPEPLIRDDVATIPGTDGRKMSKSHGNVIPLFESSGKLRKRIMRIVTDSTPMEQPKDPHSCAVFNLYRNFTSEEQAGEMEARYKAGGFGYGHAKQELFRVMDMFLAGPRERYRELMATPQVLEDILAEGAMRARKVARETIFRVREVTGLKKDLTSC